MYGLLFRLKTLPGQTQPLEVSLHRLVQERVPEMEGIVAIYVMKPLSYPGELIGLAVFDSQSHYTQALTLHTCWYQQLELYLGNSPKWVEGEITALEITVKGL